jgi:hypothetical protein
MDPDGMLKGAKRKLRISHARIATVSTSRSRLPAPSFCFDLRARDRAMAACAGRAAATSSYGNMHRRSYEARQW